MGKHEWSRGGMTMVAAAGLSILLVAAAGLSILLLVPVAHAQGNPIPDSTEDSTFSAYGPPTGLQETPPEYDAFAGDRPIAPAPWNRAVSANLSLGSMLINAVFFPVKLAVGLVGAEVGGLAGAMNGGDEEAARGIWNVTTDGSYFVTPAALDGRSEFTLGSDAP